MSPQIYNWKSMLPVVLEVAADGKPHHRTDYIEAVRRVTARDFGDEIHRKLKHGYSYEDRANWATFELRRSGLLADVERAVTQITPEGIQWLKDNPYPLRREQQREFVKMRDRVLEAKGTIEKSSSDDDADEPETSDDYVWVLRAGKDGVREKRALQENLGLPGLYYNEEVESTETLDEIKKAMRAAYPEWKRGQINTQAGQLYRFRTKLQVGDIVLMPSNHVHGAVFHGRVTGPVTIDRSEPDAEAHLRVPIEWSKEPFQRDELGIDLRRSITSLLTLSQVKRNNAHERFLSVIDGSGDPDFDIQDFSTTDSFVLDWISFNREFAERLLSYRTDRTALLEKLREAARLSERPSLFNMLWEWSKEDGKETATDIDPFTVYALINRSLTISNKEAIYRGLKEAFDISAEVPTSVDGLPVRNNLSARFESKYTDPGNTAFYDGIWTLFEAALRYNPREKHGHSRVDFIDAYDAAVKDRSQVAYTMGLFWIRPETFMALDRRNADFLKSEDGMGIDVVGTVTDGASYLATLTDVADWLQDSMIDPPTFAGLSATAFQYAQNESEAPVESELEELTEEAQETYSIQDILNAGCFLDRKQLETILRRWREKKNLILQGPPGTGKTWLGRKLAYAMLEDSSDETITAVQFHPSTSYEDFIEGFRPASDGHLRLQPGPFLKAVRAASNDEGRKHFIIIEEINRGNPAQIFGEMLTLLEADKRNVESALTTIYSPDSEPIFLPENLYVIGTMNQADRSLAMVDMALRRRFAFVDLQPQFNERWLDYCSTNCGYDRGTLEAIGTKLDALNARIAADINLGRDYEVGHSFVTPRRSSKPLTAEETRKWFDAIVDTDLAPLLREYWYDQPEVLKEALRELRA
ncbi:hypothetical protein CSTAT_01380 [Corynebacterium stationis]|uniref:AAA family ATPase n=1 Tax=Corynebacterium stationis TaxID=1705 RepID=UPI000950A479|nr:AAA family ATPase [Corynebacterium stationis]APT94053.1 hypothetical protein CSTAT_01380 [Corynebacterium stationis]